MRRVTPLVLFIISIMNFRSLVPDWQQLFLGAVISTPTVYMLNTYAYNVETRLSKLSTRYTGYLWSDHHSNFSYGCAFVAVGSCIAIIMLSTGRVHSGGNHRYKMYAYLFTVGVMYWIVHLFCVDVKIIDNPYVAALGFLFCLFVICARDIFSDIAGSGYSNVSVRVSDVHRMINRISAPRLQDRLVRG
jgi:hypothetical protein